MRLARRFADLRLGARLAVVFGLSAAAVLGVVVAGVLRLDALNADFTRTVAERQAKTELVHGIVEEFGAMSGAVSSALLAEGREAIAAELSRIDAGKRSVSRLLESLGMPDEHDRSEEALRILACDGDGEVRHAVQIVHRAVERIDEPAVAGHTGATRALLSDDRVIRIRAA